MTSLIEISVQVQVITVTSQIVLFKSFHFTGHQFLHLENEYAYEGDDIPVVNCGNVAEIANWETILVEYVTKHMNIGYLHLFALFSFPRLILSGP